MKSTHMEYVAAGLGVAGVSRAPKPTPPDFPPASQFRAPSSRHQPLTAGATANGPKGRLVLERPTTAEREAVQESRRGLKACTDPHQHGNRGSGVNISPYRGTRDKSNGSPGSLSESEGVWMGVRLSDRSDVSLPKAGPSNFRSPHFSRDEHPYRLRQDLPPALHTRFPSPPRVTPEPHRSKQIRLPQQSSEVGQPERIHQHSDSDERMSPFRVIIEKRPVATEAALPSSGSKGFLGAQRPWSSRSQANEKGRTRSPGKGSASQTEGNGSPAKPLTIFDEEEAEEVLEARDDGFIDPDGQVEDELRGHGTQSIEQQDSFGSLIERQQGTSNSRPGNSWDGVEGSRKRDPPIRSQRRPMRDRNGRVPVSILPNIPFMLMSSSPRKIEV